MLIFSQFIKGGRGGVLRLGGGGTKSLAPTLLTIIWKLFFRNFRKPKTSLELRIQMVYDLKRMGVGQILNAERGVRSKLILIKTGLS